MVNVGLGFSSVLGIALAASGLALYFLRSFRPKLARDQDIFFSAVALLCGGILFFQGWRQDPILQFGQFLLTGSAVFFAVESVRLRGVATEQARRSTPIVDEERPVSRVYRAELDEFDAFDDRAANTRRIRGSNGSRAGRDITDEVPRRRSASGRGEYGNDSRRSRNIEDPYAGNGQDYFLEDEDSRSRRSRTGSNRPSNPPASRPRRPRIDDEPVRSPSRRSSSDASSSEYVDYRPVNDDESDNWGDE
jgi:hypothetical protein